MNPKSLAIDLDGPLYEWDKTARYMLREYRGCKWLVYPSITWDDIQENVTPEDWKWLWTEGVSKGLFRHGHVTKHAIKAVKELRAMGYTLHILTHRPGTPEAMKDTLEWVKFHFGDDFDSVNVEPQRSKGLYLDAYTLIDDKIENLRDWTDTGRPGILFDRPWNARTPYHPRANGWYEVLEILGATATA